MQVSCAEVLDLPAVASSMPERQHELATRGACTGCSVHDAAVCLRCRLRSMRSSYLLGLKLLIGCHKSSADGRTSCLRHECKCALQLSCPAHADTARPPLGLTESLQEGQRRHSSDLERAESLVRDCDVAALAHRPVATCILQVRGHCRWALAFQIQDAILQVVFACCRTAAATVSGSSHKALLSPMASTGATGQMRCSR